MKLRIFANIFVLVIGVGLALYLDQRIETVSAGQAQNTHYLLETMEAVTQNLEAIFHLKKATTVEDVQVLTVTAYTPSPDETDSDPYITASMVQVRPGCLAVSRDLFADGWVFGKKVYIEGLGIFTILDLMNPRYEKRVDVLLWSKEDAKQFGRKELAAALLKL